MRLRSNSRLQRRDAELTAKLGCVEAAGHVAGAVTKPFVGWMLLTLNTPVTSLPGLDAEGLEV